MTSVDRGNKYRVQKRMRKGRKDCKKKSNEGKYQITCYFIKKNNATAF